MNYTEIKTSKKMNKAIKETLKIRGDSVSHYALKRIEELKELIKELKTQCSNDTNNCKYIKKTGESCTLNNNCKYPNCEH